MSTPEEFHARMADLERRLDSIIQGTSLARLWDEFTAHRHG